MNRQEKETPIGALLHQFLNRHPSFTANPLGDWADLVGEQVARYSRPKSLKNKVLVIMAYDSVWKHHLELNREGLVEKINRGRPEVLVEKISIRVGEVPDAVPDLNPIHRQLSKLKGKRVVVKKEKVPARRLTAEEQSLLKQLPDAELRTIGARLLKRLPLEEGDEAE